MAVRLFSEPLLDKPDMVVGWPGIANVGLIAIDVMRQHLGAEQFGEIEPWEFFYPRGLTIRAGVLDELEFPSNRFYFKRNGVRDLVIFIGEEQPTTTGGSYAQGGKAYRMANLVLDVAQKLGCRRIYTSGAAVALTHHAAKPGVWVVATGTPVLNEIKSLPNVTLMSQALGREGQGSITGLNGLLLGVARKRGLEGACLMGEVPDYLAQAPFPYPRASQSVLEVLGTVLGLELDPRLLDGLATQMDETIDSIYKKFPDDIRERIEQRKVAAQAGTETITEEDEKWLREHIDDFFTKGGGGGERPV